VGRAGKKRLAASLSGPFFFVAQEEKDLVRRASERARAPQIRTAKKVRTIIESAKTKPEERGVLFNTAKRFQFRRSARRGIWRRPSVQVHLA